MKIIPVSCLVLLHQGKVLATQRSETMDLPGLWEFPGGKVEFGESPATCLVREIWEELSIGIQICNPLTPVLYAYPDKSIQLIPFLATWGTGTLQLSEHAHYQWLAPQDLLSLDWAPADLPIVEELQEHWDSFLGLT